MELEEHVYPVLLCVDHIKVKEKSATETDGEESQVCWVAIKFAETEYFFTNVLVTEEALL